MAPAVAQRLASVSGHDHAVSRTRRTRSAIHETPPRERTHGPRCSHLADPALCSDLLLRDRISEPAAERIGRAQNQELQETQSKRRKYRPDGALQAVGALPELGTSIEPSPNPVVTSAQLTPALSRRIGPSPYAMGFGSRVHLTRPHRSPVSDDCRISVTERRMAHSPEPCVAHRASDEIGKCDDASRRQARLARRHALLCSE
jgi:hypothetical protein